MTEVMLFLRPVNIKTCRSPAMFGFVALSWVLSLQRST
ncbi:hypothetical protein Q669_13490 [Labrenzia sp. C1B10]|nr:hypothetical protein Q669_13490 [Labrenzia sp. C1B10]ERS08076.1 hypothetical protein Q675_22120 [Labrenzia sp. C1B70]